MDLKNFLSEQCKQKTHAYNSVLSKLKNVTVYGCVCTLYTKDKDRGSKSKKHQPNLDILNSRPSLPLDKKADGRRREIRWETTASALSIMFSFFFKKSKSTN